MSLPLSRLWLFAIALLLTAVVTLPASAGEIRLSQGQTVYVPAYAHVYSGAKGLPFPLAVSLSVRNTDPRQAISITVIDYYDNDGRRLKRYLERPLRLGPLASHHVYLQERDSGGGFGANFIVRWEAASEVNAPLIESVMIGAKSGQGISFTGQGQVIKD